MIDKITKILDKSLCDHCLGRSYAQLLYGHRNDERGKFIRTVIAMMIDGKMIDYSNMNPNNFYGFTFKQNKEFAVKTNKEKCWLCNDIFDNMDSLAKKAEKKLGKIDFNNFLVGSKVPEEVLEKEESLWEITGIEYVESIKAEINRELGKKLGFIFRKPTNFKNPEIVVLADFDKKDVDVQINSLYVFGYYQKLIRGIPQCKWGTPGKYKTSIQEIIAKPFMKATKGKDNAMHGYGREDVDARCFGWRPFVIEIKEPQKRYIDLKHIQKEINKTKKIRLNKLRFVDRSTVVRVKTEKGDKTYKVIVEFDKKIDKKNLKKLKELIGTISQRTPVRVAHRRADLIRRRIVKELRYKQIGSKKIELTIKSNAGLYIKELVTGDEGRTKPSVAELLNVKAVPKELDVIKIESPKNL